MSHYTTLVIGENPEEQLEPFQELDLSREELIENEYSVFVESFRVEELEERFKAFKEENKEKIEEGKGDYWVKYRTCSEEEWVENWEGLYLNKEKTKYGYYANPNAKWDWYVIGGRWSGMLKLKPNSEGDLKEPDCFGICEDLDKERIKQYNENKEKRCVDSALKKDVDFSRDEEEHKRAVRFWELYVEKQKPINKKEEEIIKSGYYKVSYYKETYKTKEIYARSRSEFGTFAVLKDGEWFEKGSMGWFGCSSETGKETRNWDKGYFEQFIRGLPEDTLLTIVDCHI